MKIPAAAYDNFLRKESHDCIAVLLYGPNQGRVREDAETLVKTHLGDLDDAMRLFRLDGETAAREPNRFIVATQTPSLLGDRQVVWIRHAGDILTASIKLLLAAPTPPAALVIIEATALKPQSSLRRLFEQQKRLAVMVRYEENDAAIARQIRDHFGSIARKIDRDGLDHMAALCGGDRGAMRTMLEQLSTYVADQNDGYTITGDDVTACLGDGDDGDYDHLVDAVAGDDARNLDRALVDLMHKGMAAPGLIRVTLNHFTRLLELQGGVAAGKSFEQAIMELKPRPYFKRKDVLQKQVQMWSIPALIAAINLLNDAEAACKQSHIPIEALCSRYLQQARRLWKHYGDRIA